MNKERLLNVARALRESPNPDRFDMGLYVHDPYSYEPNDDADILEAPDGWCGSPACAMGHYAARTDLQDLLYIRDDGFHRFRMAFSATQQSAYHNSRKVLAHFDLDDEQIEELFGSFGCGFAKTPTEAAEYIEKFVADHS